MNEKSVCMADIKNKIYEAGLFRDGEKIVLTTESCVLLEYYTGKTYSYRMIDITSLKAKRLFSRQNPLNETGYQRAIEKMMGAGTLPAPIVQPTDKERAMELLSYIFSNIFPSHGMSERENQRILSMEMLQGLQEGKLALCEAEVGTGKTHAYILAVTVHNLFSERKMPTIISTSTIALQKALTEEYIPQISDILMEHRIIDQPLSFVVRKGKRHHACDARVKNYQSSVQHNNRIEDQALLDILHKLYTGGCPIDLDGLPLTDYVKGCICVTDCHNSCPCSAICRYRSFTRSCLLGRYDFQITNHNMVFADILSKKNGRPGLFPNSGAIIFDEAHKLLNTARQMYGMSFDSTELERLSGSILRTIGNRNPDKLAIIRLSEELLRLNALLFDTLKQSKGVRYEKDCYQISLDYICIGFLRGIERTLRALSLLFFTMDYEKKAIYNKLVNRMEEKSAKIAVLLDYSQHIHWMELTGVLSCRICSLPKQLDFLLNEDIWSKDIPYILTSGTLSVGGDFSHFKQRNGIALVERGRLFEASKASPFNYQENALLYFAKDMPAPQAKENSYQQAIVERLAELIAITHGHTMILFTSYRQMEQTYTALLERITDYPLFLMGKGKLDTLSAFRKSGNGVLFASDSAGEGIDLAGDILSSLIVVRLPFPVPDPVLEYEKSLYDNFYNYLGEIVVPEMLTKLRQWIGRGIRRETDSCVFSILDSRANGRYKKDILAALPDMPVTDQLSDIGRFLLSKRDNSYFE